MASQPQVRAEPSSNCPRTLSSVREALSQASTAVAVKRRLRTSVR